MPNDEMELPDSATAGPQGAAIGGQVMYQAAVDADGLAGDVPIAGEHHDHVGDADFQVERLALVEYNNRQSYE